MAKVRAITQAQLDGFADLVADAEEAGERGLDYAAIEARKLTALNVLRDVIDQDEAPDWTEKFQELMLSNIPWRIAAYIAWAVVPKHNRHPKTLGELATQVLGLSSPRRIFEWRKKYAYIDQMVASLSTAILLDYVPGSIEASGKVAAQVDYKATSERRLLWEAVGIINRNQKITLEDDAIIGKGRKLLDQLRKMPAEKKIELLGDDAETFFAELEDEFAEEDELVFDGEKDGDDVE